MEEPLCFKVRTITAFTCGQSIRNGEDWEIHLHDVIKKLRSIESEIEATGVEVQTIRVSTNVLTNLLKQQRIDIQSLISKTVELEKIAHGLGLQFLNLGVIDDRDFVSQMGSLSDLVSSLESANVSVAMGQDWGFPEALHIAREILAMERKQTGSTFRFSVSFNCIAEIPYFPASYSTSDDVSFALGMENTALLKNAYSKTKEQSHTLDLRKDCPISTLKKEIVSVFSSAFKPVEDICMSCAEFHGWRYSGIDSSITPDLDSNLEECLRFPLSKDLNFDPWGIGTPATIDAITEAIKNLHIRTTGYRGVMLTVLENSSLAQAASRGNLNIQKLLLYANVCGVGLDTIPIPGISSKPGCSEEESLLQIQYKIAGLLLDMAAISKRQKKPLSVRLLPVLGSKVHDQTHFISPYLLNGNVMEF